MSSPAQLDTGCKLIDAELDRHFTAPDSELSVEARDHLRRCARCRELYQWIALPISFTDVSPESYGKVRRALQASLSPVSPLPSTRKMAILFLVVYVVSAFSTICILGFAGFHRMTSLQLPLVTGILIGGIALLSVSLARQMIPGTLQRFRTGVIVALLAAGIFAGIALLFPWLAPVGFVARVWPCSLVGSTVAIVVGLEFWLLARRGAPLSAEALGGTIGAIAGLAGVTALQFSCSRQEAAHILVWHGGVLVVSILMGILTARAFRRLRGWRA